MQRILYGQYYIRHKCKRKGLGIYVSADRQIQSNVDLLLQKEINFRLIRRNITYMDKTLIIPCTRQ